VPELTPEPGARRVRVVVSGGVQGVGFRWSTREEATLRGLAGYVRNLPDGRVEAVFEGPAEAVEGMIGWCRSGPRWAAVSGVEVREESPAGDTAFLIVR
jgi:acylphosphatase